MTDDRLEGTHSASPHSTDEQLIKALGWTFCYEEDDEPGYCMAHEVDPLYASGVCDAMRNRLNGARRGIDLAQAGIAKALTNAYLEWPDRLDLEDAVGIARDWQPGGNDGMG